MYLCFLCGSQNKQRLFPHIALSDWFFITEMESVYCAVRTGCLIITEGKFSFWRANSANKKRDVTIPYSSICSILTGPALYHTHQTRPAMFVSGLVRQSPWTSRSPCWGCCQQPVPRSSRWNVVHWTCTRIFLYRVPSTAAASPRKPVFAGTAAVLRTAIKAHSVV